MPLSKKEATVLLKLKPTDPSVSVFVVGKVEKKHRSRKQKLKEAVVVEKYRNSNILNDNLTEI